MYVAQVMKVGGVLLFRDYGLYDHAMLRFGRGHKIADNFYVRQDGTRAFYFSEGIYTHSQCHDSLCVHKAEPLPKPVPRPALTAMVRHTN